MKTVCNTLLFTFLCLFSNSQEIELKGSIGKYPIEMKIWGMQEGNEKIHGKYNYKGKTNYLTLKGNTFGQHILQLDEFYQNESTGSFYLEKSSDTLKGTWIGANKKYFKTWLVLTKGDWNDVVSPPSSELSKKTNNSIILFSSIFFLVFLLFKVLPHNDVCFPAFMFDFQKFF